MTHAHARPTPYRSRCQARQRTIACPTVITCERAKEASHLYQQGSCDWHATTSTLHTRCMAVKQHHAQPRASCVQAVPQCMTPSPAWLTSVMSSSSRCVVTRVLASKLHSGRALSSLASFAPGAPQLLASSNVWLHWHTEGSSKNLDANAECRMCTPVGQQATLGCLTLSYLQVQANCSSSNACRTCMAGGSSRRA